MAESTCTACGDDYTLGDEREPCAHGMCWPCASDALDARDSTIAEQAEEIERLKAQAEDQCHPFVISNGVTYTSNDITRLRQRAEAAEAEVKRLTVSQVDYDAIEEDRNFYAARTQELEAEFKQLKEQLVSSILKPLTE